MNCKYAQADDIGYKCEARRINPDLCNDNEADCPIAESYRRMDSRLFPKWERVKQTHPRGNDSFINP